MKMKRILVAENDEQTLRMVRSALKSAQCQLLEAKTRGEAKRLLREEKDISAVVTSFVDSRNANKKEDEFSDQWLRRQSTFWPLIRVLQNGCSDDLEDSFVKIGVATIEKPFRSNRLAEVLKNLLQKNVVPQNWVALQKLLLNDSWNSEKHKHISPYVFRGLDDAAWRLKTKFTRLTNNKASNKHATPLSQIEQRRKQEEGMIRNFKKYAETSVSDLNTLWHWLSLGQHYGLATRLMDWTYSPLVALHFATKNQELRKRDGVIWAVNYLNTHGRENSLPKPNGNLPCRVQELLEKQEGDLFTVETLSIGIKGQKGFEGLAEFDKEGVGRPFVLFFEPPSFDQRIVNQFAVFSVASSRDIVLDDWLEENQVKCTRIVVPSFLKAEIREKLDQCNISERTLFPGLDGICSWLNRHYGPPWRDRNAP